MWLHLHFHGIQHNPLICVLLVLILRHPCTSFILYINIAYMCMHPNPTKTKTQTVINFWWNLYIQYACISFHHVLCIPYLTPSHILGKKWNEMIATDYQQFIIHQKLPTVHWKAKPLFFVSGRPRPLFLIPLANIFLNIKNIQLIKFQFGMYSYTINSSASSRASL